MENITITTDFKGKYQSFVAKLDFDELNGMGYYNVYFEAYSEDEPEVKEKLII